MYSAQYRGEAVAVKILHANSLSSKVMKQFQQEVNTMNLVRSRYVTRVKKQPHKEREVLGGF